MRINNSTKSRHYFKGLFLVFLSITASVNFCFATPYRTTLSSFLWSDYTSWEVFSGGSWVATTLSTQIPGDTDDVTVIDGSYIRITGSVNSCLTLTIQGSGVVAMQGSLSVKSTSSSALSIPSGTFTASSGTLSVTGGLNQTGGAFNSSASAIVNLGAGLSLNNATISGVASVTGDFNVDGVVQIFNSITVTSGDVNINSGGNFNFKAGSSASLSATTSGKTVTVGAGGTLTVNPGTSISCAAFTTIAGATSITINGSLNINGGVWTNGGAVSGIGGTVYNYSALNTSGGSAIALSAGGVLNGPFDGTTEGVGSSSIDLTSGSISSLGVASTIKINGGFTIPTGSFAAGSSTITAYGTSSISAGSSVSLNNISVASGSLTLNSTGTIVTVAGTVSNAGTLNVAGLYQFTNLNNTGGLTNTGTISINGAFTDNGSLSSSSGTFDFNGTGPMSITSTSTTKFFNLKHSGSGALTSTTDFEVAGNYQNTGVGIGTYTGNKITFSGSLINGGTNGTTFNNMLIKGNLGMFNSSTNNVNLKGVLTLNASGNSFDASGNSGSGNAVFTILSTGPTFTGAIAPIPSGASISGKMTIQRWLNSGPLWKYLAIPISSTFYVSNLQAGGFNVNGHFASGGSDNPTGAGPIVGESMYTWDAPSQSWNGIGWGAGATSATTLSNTVGYSAYYYGSSAAAISFTGTPTTGSVGITLSPGDNLIPNPYPAGLDFTKFSSRANLNKQMSVETNGNTGGVLASYDDNLGMCSPCLNTDTNWKGAVALGQSFWVNSTISSGTSTLTLTESDKLSSSTSYFSGKIASSTPENYIRIRLESNNMSDETIVAFKDYGSENYLPNLDFIKRLNGNPSLDGTSRTYVNLATFKKTSDKNFVFNYMPLLDCQTGSKVVGINVSDLSPGNHTLKFSDLESFKVGYVITLIDKSLNKQVSVANGTAYTFTTSSDASSYGSGRFELKIDPMPLFAPIVSVSGTKLSVPASPIIQWYKNGVAISGATNSSFEATESGNYTVRSGYSSVCTMESLPVVVTITGLESNISAITVYPNPTENTINLQFPSGMTIDRASLLNSRGEYVSELTPTNTSDNSISIDISAQSSGLYILNLKSGSANHSIKILKK